MSYAASFRHGLRLALKNKTRAKMVPVGGTSFYIGFLGKYIYHSAICGWKYPLVKRIQICGKKGIQVCKNQRSGPIGVQ